MEQLQDNLEEYDRIQMHIGEQSDAHLFFRFTAFPHHKAKYLQDLHKEEESN